LKEISVLCDFSSSLAEIEIGDKYMTFILCPPTAIVVKLLKGRVKSTTMDN